MSTRIKVNGVTKYSGGRVSIIANEISEVLDECCIPETFINSIVISEKVGSKFRTPTNPLAKTLYVFVGGWRLVGQDRMKADFKDSTMFGVETGLNSNIVYAPSVTANYVVRTPEGMPVLEVISDEVINILFDICNPDLINRKQIIKTMLLDVFINCYNFSIEELKRKRESLKQDAISSFLQSLASEEARQQETIIKDIEQSITSLELALETHMRNRREAMLKREMLLAQSLKASEGIGAEIDKITSLQQIGDISIDPDAGELVIKTNDIYANNANKRYYIGRFDLYVNPRSCSIRFDNLNNKRRSYWGPRCHHPHVDEKGYACWGNVGTAIREYIATNEYLALTSLLLGFLESANTSDPAGKNLTRWDVVNSSGQILHKGYDPSNPPANIETYRCYECGEDVSRDSLAFTNRAMHICGDCKHKYAECAECGDIHSIGSGDTCDECGVDLCEDCYEDNSNCSSCQRDLENDELEDDDDDDLEEGQETCPYCNSVVNEEDLFTCETCGTQGCGECIQFDGRYTCPRHR